ncbi:MAG: hypothetical protein B1H11_01585 [Desulfobacteraceae bacterium 4484_190.1]|nr:MAG: hypothetical protein B1H11_01585 [Desulfobacteraceae bacterium 4484_190.1]
MCGLAGVIFGKKRRHIPRTDAGKRHSGRLGPRVPVCRAGHGTGRRSRDPPARHRPSGGLPPR